MDQPKDIRRTQEIEEFTNRRLIHPISGWLVPRLNRLDVHPNTVSLAGAASGIVAALFYYRYEHTAATVAGFLFMVGWHILDGADGQLARLSGKVTPSGYVIDGLCDYTTFLFVYLALGMRLAESAGGLGWALVIAAGASHVIQAAAFELQRSVYNQIAGGKAFVTPSATAPREQARGVFAGLASLYESIQAPFHPLDASLRERVLAFANARPAQAAAISGAYREHFQAGVLEWSLLSANNHTIAIFAACALARPELYFLFELLLLNGALFWLVRGNQLRRLRLDNWLAANGGGEK